MISTLFRPTYASAALLCALALAAPGARVTPIAWAQTEVAKSDYAAALGWDNNRQGAFLTAAIQDSRGDIWVATEDKGVWRYDARDKKWVGFDAALTDRIRF